MNVTAGNKIRNAVAAVSNYGTVGGIVLYKNKPHLLTCFHCVYSSRMNWSETIPTVDTAAIYSNSVSGIGRIIWTTRNEAVDLSLIELDQNDTFDKEISGWGAVKGIRYLTDNDVNAVFLKKYGATTKETYGKFNGIKPQKGTLYPDETELHYLNNLIRISSNNGIAFSDEGDSGAFILDSNNFIVGILVMGNQNFTYAISIATIESLFMNIKFIL